MPKRKRKSRQAAPPPAATLPSAKALVPRAHVLALLGALAVITAVAYWPALQGGFLWDDDAHITKPELRSLTGLSRIWFDPGATQQYYPLLHSAFWLEHKLWGDATLGYHLVNVALHITAACIAYFVLCKLAVPGAWLAAAIFALHPVQVESVAWITEQKNTLSAVFYLSAMWVYLGFNETRTRSSYLLALALFILGLMTKTVTATLPAALLVILWWQHGNVSWQRDVRPLIPFFVLGAVAGLFTAWVERNLIGAAGADFELSPIQRSLLAGRVIVFYLSKLAWPANLTFIYPRWNVDPAQWWQWLFSAGVLSVTACLWAARRRWRAPLAGWLFFVGTLFPVLGFLNVYPFIYSFVADHFQYLASFGMFVLVAAATNRVIVRLPHRARWAANAMCGALLVTLAVLTWRQSRTYGDAVTLYQTTIARNPTCWMAINNLGVELARMDRPQEAMQHYRRALELRPKYAEAWFNLGNSFDRAGQPQQAIECYNKAIAIRPGYADARNNLGGMQLKTGKPVEAIRQFELLLAGDPNHTEANNNMGIAQLATGQTAPAIRHFEHALRLRPDYAEAHNGFADALLREGKLPQAIEHYQMAVQFRPDYVTARNSLGVALAKAGRLPEAIGQFEQALRLNPPSAGDSITAYANLARAYGQLNRRPEAIATAHKALEFARSHGQAEAAAQIESWLASYDAGASKGDATPPTSTPAPSVTAPQN